MSKWRARPGSHLGRLGQLRGRSEAEGEAPRGQVICRHVRDAQQLNERHGHNQEPIVITVGIIEWLTNQSDFVVAVVGEPGIGLPNLTLDSDHKR